MRSSRIFATLVLVACTAIAGPVFSDSASIVCVQNELNELGYKAGPADGVLGNKTRSALAAYVLAMQAKTDANWSMPPLTSESAKHTCQIIADAYPEVSRFWLALDIINGLDVAVVDYKSTPNSPFGNYSGTYRNIGNGRWRESSTQATFNLLEKSRTTERITLFDDSRNVTVLIWAKMGGDIAFVYNGGPVTTFATVTGLARGTPQ